MTSIEFDVQGSAETPYKVAFSIDGKNLTATCTCPAGAFGTYCKHRILILAGDTEGIVGGNLTDVLVVRSWLQGTDVAEALTALEAEERELDRLKKRVAAAKKALAAAMNS